MRLKAVLFDAYGTLFDVHSVALVAEQMFPGRGDALSQAWRQKQIEYTHLVTLSSRYRPFWELTRSALRQAARRLELALDDAGEQRLMNQYLHLSPFPEALEVLCALREQGLPTGILSNGDPEMLAVGVRSAGFEPHLQHLLSVHEVRRYKTDPAAYALGPRALGLPARDILFVSSNAWDAIGATWYGYTTLWVNRGGAAPEQLGTDPSYTGRSLRDALDCLAAP
ncbi:MAG TPA: haloacid dehalogenase type II [Rubrivivax sp.]|jgi:2-haloacid dehalogenase|nr:haloacid dehalogenase type II [Rubrivivax sp.]